MRYDTGMLRLRSWDVTRVDFLIFFFFNLLEWVGIGYYIHYSARKCFDLKKLVYYDVCFFCFKFFYYRLGAGFDVCRFGGFLVVWMYGMVRYGEMVDCGLGCVVLG